MTRLMQWWSFLPSQENAPEMTMCMMRDKAPDVFRVLPQEPRQCQILRESRMARDTPCRSPLQFDLKDREAGYH